MKVILLTDIPKIGNKYDVKEFKEGYAQNVLLSKGLACLATKAELSKLEDRKRKIQLDKEHADNLFDELINQVNNKLIIIKVKSNDKGHLFKAVLPRDVSVSIKENTSLYIDEGAIIMEHIKELGLYSIMIKKGDKKGKCQIKIESL